MVSNYTFPRLCTKSHRTVRSGPLRSAWFVLLREISCNFVDRLLRIRSHTIHEITLSSTKEHQIRIFVQSQPGRELILSRRLNPICKRLDPKWMGIKRRNEFQPFTSRIEKNFPATDADFFQS